MKQCNCEHWQICPTCKPRWFDTDGNMLPPEPTPLQSAHQRISELEQALKEKDTCARQCEGAAYSAMSDRLDEIAARLYTLDISTAANWIESQEERITELETLLGFVVSGGIQRVNTELHQRILKALDQPQ